MTRGVVALGLVLLGSVPWHVLAQQTVFRTDTSMVFVNVSVKRGNNPVPGLQASDFALFDNGVRQKVSSVSLDALPLDVSLFMDTSGSTAGALAEMKRSIHDIVGMLGTQDRFRLLTIGLSVYETIPWTSSGTPVTFGDAFPVQGISLVYDAFYAASVHAVEPGRRHLVVELTDGDDECSVVRPTQLRDLVGRTDAVVHWVPLRAMGRVRIGTAICDQALPDKDIGAIDELVDGTGGQKHTGFLGLVESSPVKAFKRVLDDYRQSYVLHYVPEGVPRQGWHQLKVEVPPGRYTVRARSGYYGG